MKIKKIILPILPYILFILLTIIIFKPYIVNHKVPFPGNLLVSFYQPWASYQWQGYAESGPPNKPIGFDNLRIFYPIRQLTIQEMKQGTWPLWNPYDFSGNMQLATYQSAVFHPMSLLFFLLPQIDARSIIIVLTPILAMILMYLYLRELDVGKQASTLGAVGFGLSGFFIVNMEESMMVGYTALFFPLILLGIERLNKKTTVWNMLIVIVGVLCSILSGWFQLTLYEVAFSLIYAVMLFWRRKNLRVLSLIFLCFILGFIISAPQIFPAFEAYANSARGTTDAKFLFDTYLVPWYHVITYIAPDFFGNPASYNYWGKGFYYEKILYVGLPILFFGLYGAFASFGKKDRGLFYTLAWIISLSLGFALPTSRFLLYSLHIPLLSTMLPARIFFLSTFCICVLAAYGWENYRKKASLLWLCMVMLIISAVLASGWIYVIFIKLFIPKVTQVYILLRIHTEIAVAKRNLFLPTIFTMATIVLAFVGHYKPIRRYIFYLFLVTGCVSGIYFSNKYLYFSDREFTFPEVPVIQALTKIAGNDRVWSFGKAYVERNFLTYYHLQSPEGYDAFSIQRYSELLFAAQNHGTYTPNIPRADAIVRSAENISEVVNDPLRLKLLSLLGVKYIVGPRTVIDRENGSDLLKPVWNDQKFVVYKYTNSLPRVFLADTYSLQTTNQNILSTLFDPSFNVGKTLILEKTPEGFSYDKTLLQYYAHITLYEPEKVRIDVHTNKKSLLFLSDNYYPGWNAYIDNHLTPTYRADYSFRSIVVPKGKHTIVFLYQPVSFYTGLLLSVVSIVVLGVVIFVVVGKKRTSLDH